VDALKSLVIVEDEAIVAMDLCEELASIGFEVRAVVGESRKVIEAIRTHRPSVVLMDIALRGDVQGLALAEEIFVCEDTPVVFLTAFADRTTLGLAAHTGAYGLLTKPVTVAALASTLELAIEKHAALQAQREQSRWLGVADVGAVWMQPDGRVGLMNRAAVQLIGWMTVEAKLDSSPPRWVAQLAELVATTDLRFVHELMLEVRPTAAPIAVRVAKYRLSNGGSLCLLHRATAESPPLPPDTSSG